LNYDVENFAARLRDGIDRLETIWKQLMELPVA
jgi:hypothetical protein